MRRLALIGLFLAVAAMAATVGTTASLVTTKRALRPSAETCGGLLWRLKTFSDRQRRTVQTAPHATTIAVLAQRPFPAPLPRSRSTKFQRQTYEVVASITEYRLDGNELRLVLYDHGSYMNAVVPAPACLTKTTRRKDAIAAVWSTFFPACGRPERTWQTQGAVAYVGGVGFWSSRFKQRRHAAPNGAELHPVTELRPIAGCGR
jgi:hypothetical protein